MKSNQRGAIGVVEMGLIAVLIIFSGFVVWRIAVAETETNESAAATTIGSESVALPSGSEAVSAPAPGQEAVTENFSEITLEAVNGFDATGTASRAFNEQTYTHEVIMQAPAPAEGKFYEGWVVGPSIVSTGKLTDEGGNEWSLSFTSTEDLSNHNMVVITEETRANGLDGIPETHVLDGSFAN